MSRILIACLAGLSACSGGGGGSGDAPPNVAPTVGFSAPFPAASVPDSGTLTVVWTADDPDDVAQISFHLRAAPSHPAPPASYSWPTSHVDPDGSVQVTVLDLPPDYFGDFELVIRAADPTHSVEATTPETIERRPGLSFLMPAGPIDAYQADPVALVWRGQAHDGQNATIDFSLEPAAPGSVVVELAAGIPLVDGIAQTQIVELPACVTGTFQLVATVRYDLASGSGAVRVSWPYPVDIADVSFLALAGGDSTDSGRVICALPGGDLICGGHFVGDANFGIGEPGGVTLHAGTTPSFFLARYNGGDGHLVWVRHLYPTSTSGNSLEDLNLMADGSLLLVGSFAGTLRFNWNGTSAQKSLTALGTQEGFIARYDQNGNVVGTPKRIGKLASTSGTVTAATRSVASSPSGAIYVGGRHDGPATIAIGEPGQATWPDTSSHDVFIARYDANLLLEWWARITGPNTDSVLEVVATPDDGVVVGGYFDTSCTAQGQGGAGGLALSPHGGIDGFVVKYNASGYVEWVRAIGGTGQDEVLGVAVLQDGTIAVSGEFNGSARFGDLPADTLTGVGGNDAFVAFYTPTGDYLGGLAMGSDGDDLAKKLQFDVDGRALVSGEYQCVSSLPAVFGAFQLPCAPQTNGFLAAVDPNLAGAQPTVEWVLGIHGPDLDRVADSVGLGDGTIAFTGWYSDHAAFATPCAASAHSPGTINGVSYDAYVARIHRDGSF